MDKDLKRTIKETLDSFFNENNVIDENSFRIYNKTLSPDLWDEYQHLDPEIRTNLLRIAYDFYEKTKFIAPILDVWLMGSIANYNWTPDSDVDVHIIIDFSQLKMPPETASKVAKVAGAAWNKEHEITVKRHKVEINIQSVKSEKPYVMGIYSLVKDEWVRKPSHINLRIDKYDVKDKYEKMRKYVDFAIKSGNREEMKKAKDYLDDYRQCGLDNGGELSVENIVYKILRSKGIIKILKDSIVATYDKEMTVQETSNGKVDSGYIGSTYGGDLQAIAVSNPFSQLHKDHGMISGVNSNNWRYSKNGQKVLWNTAPSNEDKMKVDDFLHKKGITNYIHKNMYSNLEEVIDKDIRKNTYSGYVLPSLEVKAIRSDLLPNEQEGHEYLLSRNRDIDVDTSFSWRYRSDLNIIYWWHQIPEDIIKYSVEYWIQKKIGKKSPKHVVLSGKDLLGFSTKGSDLQMAHGMSELNQKNISSKHPNHKSLNLDKTAYDFKKLTLGNLKSLRDKSKGLWMAWKDKEDMKQAAYWELNNYHLYNNEIKRRLTYINKNPLTEEEDVDYNAAVDFHERRDREIEDLARLLKQSHGKGKVPWKTVPASLLKRTWLQFGKYNRINENDIDKIADQIMTNITRLQASTEMMGHENYDVRPELSDMGYEFTDEEWESWMTNYFTDAQGNWILSDYGLKPLKHIYVDIFNAKTPEEKLYAVDKALNVIHQRSDLSAMFVEGGKSTLQAIANQGGYVSPDDVKEGFGWGNPKDIKNDPLHIPGERWRIKWYTNRKTPKMKEEKESIEDLMEQLLMESPEIKTLKNNKKPLTDEERKTIMDSGAVWHHGPKGEKTPAVWKSEVNGKTWYVTNTHRVYQCKPNLKGAIRAYHEVVNDTS